MPMPMPTPTPISEVTSHCLRNPLKLSMYPSIGRIVVRIELVYLSVTLSVSRPSSLSLSPFNFLLDISVRWPFPSVSPFLVIYPFRHHSLPLRFPIYFRSENCFYSVGLTWTYPLFPLILGKHSRDFHEKKKFSRLSSLLSPLQGRRGRGVWGV